MSLTLTQLTKNRLQATCKLMDGETELSFSFEPYSTATERKWLEIVKEAKAANWGEVEIIARQLAVMVKTWDVTDEAGKPVPVTMETLSEVPRELMNRMLIGMAEAMRVPPASGGTSEDGS